MERNQTYNNQMNNNIGSPSAPVPKEIYRNIITRNIKFESINAVGLHTHRDSTHMQKISRYEKKIKGFILKLFNVKNSLEWLSFVSNGATLGNLQALWYAKNIAKKNKKKLLIKIAGPYHYSLKKGCVLFDISEKCFVNSLDVFNKKNSMNYFILEWVTYGDIHSGSFQCPNDDILKINFGGIYRHLDAAYGGLLYSFLRLPKLKLELFDSVVVDFHKTGQLPLTKSVFLAKKNIMLNNPFCFAYIPHGIDYTIQGSRSYRDVLDIYYYAKLYGIINHRKWIVELEKFTERVMELFYKCRVIKILKISANIVYFSFINYNKKVNKILYSYNISIAQHMSDNLKCRVYKIFCWNEISISVYQNFINEIERGSP